MNAWKQFVAVLPAMLLTAAAGTAEAQGTADNSVKYFEQDGVTYREVRSTRKRPVVETSYQQRERTVYREQVSEEDQTSHRTYYTPVTEYKLEQRWHGVYNPFVTPHLAYHYVPVTRWEHRTEEVTRPIVKRSYVPTTEVVNVPVRSQRMVNEEVVTRTAVNRVPSNAVVGPAPANLNVATRSIVGGARLDNDPPRNGGWRTASGARRY